MKRYEMRQLAQVLGLQDRYFLTRETGEEAYELLRDQLEAVPDGEPLVLRFPANQVMDASFADETIIRLGEELRDGRYGKRCLLLEGLTPDSITNIKAAIELDRTKVAFLVIEFDEAWEVIGSLAASLRETLNLVAEHGPITAPDLAKILNVAVNTASTRLKRLYDQRLIRREHEISEEGLQYIYSFWQWQDELEEIDDDV